MADRTKLEVPIPQKKVDNPECKEIVEKEKREVKEKVEEEKKEEPKKFETKKEENKPKETKETVDQDLEAWLDGQI